jgi:hypothetical protein
MAISTLEKMSESAVQYDNIAAVALRKEPAMPALTGPARYLFLRQARGAEDVPHWPPTVKPHQWPENHICAAVELTPDAMGWQLGRTEQTGLLLGEPTNGLWFSRAAAFGLMPNGRRNHAVFDLLGVRVVRPAEKGPEYASHLIVRLQPSSARGLPKDAIVVPIGSLVLSEYFEHNNQPEANFDLRLSYAALNAAPAYLTDQAILELATRAVDRAVENPRARHDMLLEVESGRVTLLGRAELSSTGDQARAALETTPGVVEVTDHMIYDEDIERRVGEALEAKGVGYLNVLVEHNLVELHGTVPDLKTLYKAKDAALAIPGVRGVVTNQVFIEPQAPTPATPASPAINGARTSSAPSTSSQQPQRPEASTQKPEAAKSR